VASQWFVTSRRRKTNVEAGVLQRALMRLQLESMSTRRVSGVTLTLAIPFSCSSMIHTMSVPSELRPVLEVEFELTEDFVPLPNFGLSP
jgi:hypothetical protein